MKNLVVVVRCRRLVVTGCRWLIVILMVIMMCGPVSMLLGTTLCLFLVLVLVPTVVLVIFRYRYALALVNVLCAIWNRLCGVPTVEYGYEL